MEYIWKGRREEAETHSIILGLKTQAELLERRQKPTATSQRALGWGKYVVPMLGACFGIRYAHVVVGLVWCWKFSLHQWYVPEPCHWRV